jgi:hypothetical protein
MRLVELEPRWFAFSDGQRVGLTFDCPHCRVERLGVAFHRQGFEAIDDAHIRAQSPSTEHIWVMREGDTFENLTLSPSIDASGVGHWHGHVTNGEIV